MTKKVVADSDSADEKVNAQRETEDAPSDNRVFFTEMIHVRVARPSQRLSAGVAKRAGSGEGERRVLNQASEGAMKDGDHPTFGRRAPKQLEERGAVLSISGSSATLTADLTAPSQMPKVASLSAARIRRHLPPQYRLPFPNGRSALTQTNRMARVEF